MIKLILSPFLACTQPPLYDSETEDEILNDNNIMRQKQLEVFDENEQFLRNQPRRKSSKKRKSKRMEPVIVDDKLPQFTLNEVKAFARFININLKEDSVCQRYLPIQVDKVI
jgi:hypothetical protein